MTAPELDDLIERLRSINKKELSVYDLDRLQAADAIAALRKDAERLDWLGAHPREATVRVGTQVKPCVFFGLSCDAKWSVREAIDLTAAQDPKP